MTPPKNRKELIEALGDTFPGRCDPESFIEAIEGLGLAIVPKDASEELVSNAEYENDCGFDVVYRRMVAANPFRKEEDN